MWTAYDTLQNKARGLYPLWKIGICRRENQRIKYSVFNGRDDVIFSGGYREVKCFLEGIEYAKGNLIVHNAYARKKELDEESGIG